MYKTESFKYFKVIILLMLPLKDNKVTGKGWTKIKKEVKN